MVTASHNPKAYTGVKLVREGALALSGDAGIGDDPRPDRRRARRTRPGGGSVEEVDICDEFRARALSFIDADEREAAARSSSTAATAWPGRWSGRCSSGSGLDLVDDLLGARRRLPRPRAEPAAAGEPAVHHRPGPRRGRRPRHRLGRRRRPLLLHRRHRRVRRRRLPHRAARRAAARRRSPARDILYDVRASRAVPDTVAAARRHRPHQPGRPRLLQDARCARGRRSSAARSPATTTSATSTTPTPARSRRC